jgi:outer membrane lipase/esterase
MHIKSSLVVAAACFALTACGGGDGDDARYDSLVSFGDSLSDVGSYRTAGIAASGGGKYTVNGPDGQVWVEQLARTLGLPAPCAAQTGLQASGVFASLAEAVRDHPQCTAYAQGGSQVSNPIGPWNAAWLQSPIPEVAFTGQLGQLTVPVTAQVAQHLARHGGRFDNKALVTVLAGANDVLVNSEGVARQSLTPQDAAAAMAAAGAALADLIKTQIVAKGAAHVVVLNLPNIASTPNALAAEALMPGARALTDLLTQTFNTQLATGLQGSGDRVLLVDLYTRNTDQIAQPQQYGLTNVTTPVCNNTFFGVEGFLAPSLTCTTATTITGDVSRYLFADSVHPTPYGHRLLRDLALQALQKANWD